MFHVVLVFHTIGFMKLKLKYFLKYINKSKENCKVPVSKISCKEIILNNVPLYIK